MYKLLDAYIAYRQIKVSVLIKIWNVINYVAYQMLGMFHPRSIVAKKDFDDVSIHILYATADTKVVTNWLAATCALHGMLSFEALNTVGTTHFIKYMYEDVIYTANIDLMTKKINNADILFDLIML